MGAGWRGVGGGGGGGGGREEGGRRNGDDLEEVIEVVHALSNLPDGNASAQFLRQVQSLRDGQEGWVVDHVSAQWWPEDHMKVNVNSHYITQYQHVFMYVFVTLSILQSQFTEKGFQKTENYEQNEVLLLFLLTPENTSMCPMCMCT